MDIGALLADVNWLAVVVGAVLAFALGWLWYTKLFGARWASDQNLSTSDNAGPMMPAMIAQAVGTFLLAWVIGITETTNSLYFAILIALTIAVLFKANGLYTKKTKYVITVDAGFILAMVVVMILTHAVL